MNLIFTILLSSLTLAVIAQDTTYYDYDGNKVNSLLSSHHYEVLYRDESDTNKVVENVYYTSGQIKSESNYYPFSEKKLHGKRKEWFENGQIRMDIDYENGELHGQLLTYWDNGQIKRNDTYAYGKLIDGKVWNSDGEESVYFNFIINPEFPGGNNSLFRFLGKNLKYPKKSRRNGIEGKVLVSFIVERNGSVTNICVVESVNEELDAETMRVVKRMPEWIAGMEDGEKVRVTVNLPIRFRIK